MKAEKLGFWTAIVVLISTVIDKVFGLLELFLRKDNAVRITHTVEPTVMGAPPATPIWHWVVMGICALVLVFIIVLRVRRKWKQKEMDKNMLA